MNNLQSVKQKNRSRERESIETTKETCTRREPGMKKQVHGEFGKPTRSEETNSDKASERKETHTHLNGEQRANTKRCSHT